MVTNEKNIESALERYASISSVAEARRTATPMLTTQGAAIAARDPRFREGMGRLREFVLGPGDPDRVAALALAWRLTSVTSMREHRRTLIASLKEPFPRFERLPSVLDDPEDRRHFGDAIKHVSGDWVGPYVAEAILTEKDGEKARYALCRALLGATTSLADQLTLLTEALGRVQFEQQDANTGRARRVVSTFDSLSEALWNSEDSHDVGEEFGPVLARLVSDSFLRGGSADPKVEIAAAEAVLRYVTTVVRLHGTLAAEAITYSFIEPLRRMFAPRDWPDPVAAAMAPVAKQVAEQLIFLVRQGIPDDALRRVYFSAVGEVSGRLRLKRMVESSAGLKPEDAQWLLTGGFPRALATQTALEETALAAVDREVGLALREADSIMLTLETVRGELEEAADLHSKRLGAQAQRILERVGKLGRHVQSVAKRRGLELRGRTGEVVEFLPTEHEPETEAVGARTVRLKNPLVERVVNGKPVGVVVRADVERA